MMYRKKTSNFQTATGEKGVEDWWGFEYGDGLAESRIRIRARMQ